MFLELIPEELTANCSLVDIWKETRAMYLVHLVQERRAGILSPRESIWIEELQLFVLSSRVQVDSTQIHRGAGEALSLRHT